MKTQNRISGTSRFTTAPDGVNIGFTVAGRGEPALVFIHGWSCDRNYWQAQLDYFTQTHKVVALDLAGHGDSGHARQRWDMSTFGDDVISVVNELKIANMLLIGHSMGGFVALESATKLSSQVDGIIPVDIFENVNRRWTTDEIERYTAPMRADFSHTVESLVRGYFPKTARQDVVDWVSTDMAAAPPEIAISVLEMARRYDQGAGLASAKAPIHLINSDFWPTDLAAARRYNPGIELSIIPGVGHFPMIEAPDRFNGLLEQVIRQLTPRAPSA